MAQGATLIQQFLNTLDRRLDRDLFDRRDDAEAWLLEHELVEPGTALSGGDHRRLLVVRDELRELLRERDGGQVRGAMSPGAVLDDALAQCALTVAFGSGGVPRIVGVPRGGTADAVARIMEAVRTATGDGTWERLKVCRRNGCDRAFLDRSRNRSGRWCSMARCGNQLKTQRAYAARVWPQQAADLG